MRKEIGEILKERVFLLDGAYGTELIKRGLKPGIPPDLWNIENPDEIYALQNEYIKAGVDMLLTNTFGSNRNKLKELGLDSKIKEINAAAVRIAKKASKDSKKKVYIVGDIGPSGLLLPPLGNDSLDYAYEIYREQAEILLNEGVDAIIFETFHDLLELKIAFLAARELSKDVFIIVHLTFEKNSTSLTGATPFIFANLFNQLDVDTIGINCTLGPEELLPVFTELAKYSKKFLSVEPNAGMPKKTKEGIIYPVGPEKFTSFMEDYVEFGANIIGGCCGTTPKHIELMRKMLANRTPEKREIKKTFSLTSRTRVFDLNNFLSIGEKINPAGKKKLTENIKKGNIQYILKIVRTQLDKNVYVQDFNFGIEKYASKDFMREVIITSEAMYGVIPSFDIQDFEKLEYTVKFYPGVGIINSSKASEKDVEKKAELLRKYGGYIILLAMGEKLDESYKGRLEYAYRGIELFNKFGINEERIFVDPLMLALGAGNDPYDTLKIIKELNKNGIKTIVGLSNLSFGLSNRSDLNSTFLTLALDRGLNGAILNPTDERVMNTIWAFEVLKGKRKIQKEVKKEAKSIFDELLILILKGKKDELEKMIEELKETPLEIIEKYLKPVMEKIGKMYENDEIYLPQLILAADTVIPIFEKLLSKLTIEKRSEGKVLLATVKGDIHDIGKKIVGAVLKSSGFEVIDIGKDVPSDTIVKKAKEYKVDIVGLSAMMTTTVDRIGEVVKKLKDENIDVFVIAGGATVTPELAKEYGAHYAKNAVEAVKILKEVKKF